METPGLQSQNMGVETPTPWIDAYNAEQTGVDYGLNENGPLSIILL